VCSPLMLRADNLSKSQADFGVSTLATSASSKSVATSLPILNNSYNHSSTSFVNNNSGLIQSRCLAKRARQRRLRKCLFLGGRRIGKYEEVTHNCAIDSDLRIWRSWRLLWPAICYMATPVYEKGTLTLDGEDWR